MCERVRSSVARVYEPLEAVRTIQVPADPNGLFYDCHEDTLYVTDGGGDVLAIEQGHLLRIATINTAGCAANELGGIVVSRDGALYVARLGHGHSGAIMEITTHG